jgi:peroxiredoxin
MKSVFVLITALAAAAVAADVPRPTPEFNFAYPGGQKDQLSKYRGKVLLVEFLYTTCPHCQHSAQTFSRLQTEYGPKGLQVLGVAFNTMSQMLVSDFVRDHKTNFPVGFADRDPVLNYLNISVMERYVVPQVVIIDRKGQIRYQTPATGDAKASDEKFIRSQIETLLKETAPVPATRPVVKKAPAVAK